MLIPSAGSASRLLSGEREYFVGTHLRRIKQVRNSAGKLNLSLKMERLPFFINLYFPGEHLLTRLSASLPVGGFGDHSRGSGADPFFPCLITVTFFDSTPKARN